MESKRRSHAAITCTNRDEAVIIPCCVWSRAHTLPLYMEWRPGNEVSAGRWIEAMEQVSSHPDVPGRLKLNRGDIGFAQEKIMAWHEMPRVARPRYLFKLKLTTNVR